MKVMTYNIRHGWGIEKLFGLSDILTTIKKQEPDILGLNEVDIYNPRSLFVHQARSLADQLKYNYAFEPNVKIGPIGYGNAIISKFPIIDMKNHLLFSKGEQRGCLSVTLDINNEIQGKIQVLCTHLGLDQNERKFQIGQIVDIIKNIEYPSVLIGDFNCDHKELMPLKEVLLDPLHSIEKRDNDMNTFPAVNAAQRLDYIFHNLGFKAIDYKTIYAKASDHLPVLARMKLVRR